MLPCWQDAAMMERQEERHRDKRSTLQRLNLILLQFNEQVILLILQLGKQRCIIASVKARLHNIRDWASCGWCRADTSHDCLGR